MSLLSLERAVADAFQECDPDRNISLVILADNAELPTVKRAIPEGYRIVSSPSGAARGLRDLARLAQGEQQGINAGERSKELTQPRKPQDHSSTTGPPQSSGKATPKGTGTQFLTLSSFGD